MASGPGRALIRAEELYDDLDVDEQRERARSSAWRRATRRRTSSRPTWPSAPAWRPATSRCSSRRPRASPAACRSPRASSRPRCTSCTSSSSTSGAWSAASGPARCRRSRARTRRGDRAHERRGPLRRPGRAHRRRARRRARGDRRAPARPRRRRTTASRSARCSTDADWDFYKIDPLLFSPAEVRLVSVGSGRSFHAGGVALDVLERSFRG